MRLDEVWFPTDSCAAAPKFPLCPPKCPVCLSVCSNPGLSLALPPIWQGRWQHTLGLAKGPALVGPDGLTIRHNPAL